jgi:hypothetical protein
MIVGEPLVANLMQQSSVGHGDEPVSMMMPSGDIKPLT